MADTIQIRRGTTSAWNSANPVLALGEAGFDTTTKQFKVGDGTTAWTALTYSTLSYQENTAANWTSVNPVLASGEIGIETGASPRRFKIGDGSTAWNSLPYATYPFREDQIDLRSATHRNSVGAGATGAFLQARTSEGLPAPMRIYATDLRHSVANNDFSVLAGNVFRWGAIGDGIADDTAELQAALNSGEKVIVIPPSSSHFRISDTLTVPADVTVTGGGKIVQVTAGRNGLSLGNDCTVDGIQITGRHVIGNVSDSTVDNGIYASGRRNITVRNCIIDGWLCGGVQVRDSFNVDISHNLFWGSTWNFADPSSGVGSDIMVYSITSGGRYVIVGNRCHGNNSQGISFSGSGKDSYATISNNICVPLESWALPSAGTGVGGVGLLNRRHGIVVSYGGSTDSGRVTVASNVADILLSVESTSHPVRYKQA